MNYKKSTHSYLILTILVLSSLLIISGCSKQQKTYIAPQSEIKLSEVTKYTSVDKFTYNKVYFLESGSLSESMVYEVKRDTFQNVPVYIITNIKNDSKEVIYYNTDLSCVKIQAFNSENVLAEVSCPRKTGDENPTLKFQKFETISTPLGEFESKVYSYGSDNYWIHDSIPVPIKISKFDGAIILTLESFT